PAPCQEPYTPRAATTPRPPHTVTSNHGAGSTPSAPNTATSNYDAGSTPSAPNTGTSNYGAGSTPSAPSTGTSNHGAGSTPSAPSTGTSNHGAGSTPSVEGNEPPIDNPSSQPVREDRHIGQIFKDKASKTKNKMTSSKTAQNMKRNYQVGRNTGNASKRGIKKGFRRISKRKE